MPNGATGVFITTTGDAPGTNRLEITGDEGPDLICDERRSLTYDRLNEVSSASECCQTCERGL